MLTKLSLLSTTFNILFDIFKGIFFFFNTFYRKYICRNAKKINKCLSRLSHGIARSWERLEKGRRKYIGEFIYNAVSIVLAEKAITTRRGSLVM